MVRPSPLNPNVTPDWRCETPPTMAHPSQQRTLPQRRAGQEINLPNSSPDEDLLPPNRKDHTPGVLSDSGYSFDGSPASSSRAKAHRVILPHPQAKLASFYMVSGLCREPSLWSHADTDATRGMQPCEYSLNVWWRPDILGCAFSGQKTEDWLRELARMRKESKSSLYSSPVARNVRGVHIPDAGPDGAQRLVTKTLKYAHPKDIEVVNSTLAPPTICHSFTFTVPRHDNLAAFTNTQAEATGPGVSRFTYDGTSTEQSVAMDQVRSPSGTAPEITYYGVTLTIWTHADGSRANILKAVKARMQDSKTGFDSLRSNPVVPPANRDMGTKPRKSLPWGLSGNASEIDVSEAGIDESVLDGPLGPRGLKATLLDRELGDSAPDSSTGVVQDDGDIFWMPYAVTMVSRHPIYDVMQDYLRLSWARYSKNAKHHMTQVCAMLNTGTPRPGESYRLVVGMPGQDAVAIEATFPGALDFDRGLVKVDFQVWPFFQAIDLDHILTCVEVALSHSGRVVFCSRHPAMLNIAVNTLKYIMELRGWDGVCQPIIHARDMTFVIEDPGPYILGVLSECRHMHHIPPEVVVVDLDTNSLACRAPPLGVVTSRTRREKSKQRILSALGPNFPAERSVPMEFKVSYPNGTFRNFNRFIHGPDRPRYLGERLRAPSWWKHAEVITAFDKVMLDQHKKPSLIQRLTKSGMAKHKAQITVGEQLAKTMMRRRALHYVETRDDLELKVARINRRLIKLVQEGDHWKQQFETFEKYADRLSDEANDLKTRIERERREAMRISNIANEQSRQNADLEAKLRNTEMARAEAMRQLSDMHSSIQELERERDEIMTVFESQINHALEGLPNMADDTSSRPSTPSEHLPSPSIQYTGSLRPVTRESERSDLSRFTSASQPISVIGAMNGRSIRKRTVTSVADPMSSVDRLISAKSDSIASRVASIQQKLELALSNVSTHHQRSFSTTTDGSLSTDIHETDENNERQAGTSPQTLEDPERRDSNAESNADSSIIATPTASRRPSTASFALASPLPEQTYPTSAIKGTIHEIPPTPQGHTGLSSDHVEEPPRPSSSHSLMRPGVTLRIRARQRTASRSGTSSDSGGLHDRFMTDSTNGEILLSPSASRSSLGSDKTAGMKARPKTMESEGKENRMPSFRESDVGFGTVE